MKIMADAEIIMKEMGEIFKFSSPVRPVGVISAQKEGNYIRVGKHFHKIIHSSPIITFQRDHHHNNNGCMHMSECLPSQCRKTKSKSHLIASIITQRF